MRIIFFILFFSFTSWGKHTATESLARLRSGDAHPHVFVVKFKDQVNLRAGKKSAQKRLKNMGLKDFSLKPVFTKSADFYGRQRATRSEVKLSHFENYFYLVTQKKLSEVEIKNHLTLLGQNEQIEYVYLEPIYENASFSFSPELVLPLRAVETPDYEHRQFYLNESPKGVDARYAWTLPGGTGKGVRVVDLEQSWIHDHEEFEEFFIQIGELSNKYTDHGTAVWGEVAARKDGKGVTGIAHESSFGTASVSWNGSIDDWHGFLTTTLEETVQTLNAGDVLIIEQHGPGPNAGKYTAIENWDPNFEVIKLATAKGIHVIEAAGNGNSDFTHPDYEGRFDLAVRDSGAVLVGAAGSPVRDNFHRRLDFSNYGPRVDAFAYGEDVTTTGYGWLFDKGRTRTYTQYFSGTSSATPIVAGVVACLLGIAKEKGKELDPISLRQVLRETGLEQLGSNADKEPIGRFPDLKELIVALDLE